MKKLLLPVLLFVSVFTFAQTQTQHHEQKPDDPFRLQKLTDRIYALYGRGGNIGFFIGPDEVLMIDSQFKDLAPGIVRQIKSVTDKPIEYLVNTHYHPDHVGGNEFFIQFARIIAHDNVRKRVLASPQTILAEYPQRLEDARKAGNTETVRFLEDQIAWAKKIKVEEIAAPFLTFDSEFRVHLGGETIHIWHTPPAHTDGDGVAYFEKARIVHMGDLFFHKSFPFIDAKGGGSAKGYLVAIDKVLSRIAPDATVIPGHGEVTNVEGLRTFRKYIQDLNDAAAKAKAAGKSKEQFIKEIDLPAYKDWRGYDTRFKENAAVAYDEG
jgi:glyoxylase-like metal-dependent hydrolase (beta-lactamase superfamily II)